MRGMNSDSVDLIYLDPPFNSSADYSAPIGAMKGKEAKFKDHWSLDDLKEEQHYELAMTHETAAHIIHSARLTEGKGTQAYLVFMALRLIEMERILKPTGQIFLHCDDIASGWLTQLMKAVFGRAAYQNTITWQRSPGMNSGKNKVFQRTSDHILHFAGPEAKIKPFRAPLDPEYITKTYRQDDGDGKGPWRHGDLRAPAPRPNLQFKWKGYGHPTNGWCGDRAHMQRLHDEGRLHYPVNRDGTPAYDKRISQKRYLSESKGVKTGNVWTDVKMLSGKAKEKTGYPTQKPLALLERIIEAASNEGEVVFDPFCGCATTLVAADRLQRKWIGIDLCEVAVDMVVSRIKEDQPEMFVDIAHPKKSPERTGYKRLPRPGMHKAALYGEQGGFCNGCHNHIVPSGLVVDHIIPRSKGGSDEKENLQLLCPVCNSSKGDKDMAEWYAWIKENDADRWADIEMRRRLRNAA